MRAALADIQDLTGSEKDTFVTPRQITKHTRESAAEHVESGAVVRFAAA